MNFRKKENGISRQSDQRVAPGNNRINIIMAIIFLLGFGILVKLYSLQIRDFDLYAAKATSQHQMYSSLQPKRGRIFIQDEKQLGDEKLYPIATRKDFATVYVIPRDIKEQDFVAEQFFIFFDRDNVVKEVEELMEKYDEERLAKELSFVDSFPEPERESKKQDIIKTHEILIKDADYLKLKEVKKEEEVNKRKEEIIKNYLFILNKGNDPYEPIKQRVDEDVLKGLYLALAPKISSNNSFYEFGSVNLDNLKIENEKIFLVDGDKKNELSLSGVGFIITENRFYPEKNIASHLLGFVGQTKDGEGGQYGLEGFFNEELSGTPGFIKTERGAGGGLIIINDREYNKPIDGKDLILTINRTIQYTACQKLNEAATRHGADGGSVIIMNPFSGAILAMCAWPDYDPNNYGEVEDANVYNNPAIFSQYEPGSTFKALTMAIALEEGKVSPKTTYNDEGSIMVDGWDKPIKNSDFESHGGHGTVNMTTVLEESLNTGAIFAMEKAGPNIFAQYVKKFGFGEKTGIELETEAPGNIKELKKDKVQDIYAATASFGQGITATPLQMIVSYAALANGGMLVKPYLVKEIIHPNGEREKTAPQNISRIISEKASALISAMLVSVVENGHAKRAKVDGYYVAGKTGTAQVASQDKKGYGAKTIHTFIGYSPIEEPRFVMLVRLDDPKDSNFAESSAVPLFGEIAQFLLNYLEVPKERVVR